ncbi:hypothetical protein QJS10_CPA06g02287 [Acorus calamus]|uniref:Uncharacterized protein n=1 Tax=Acorus calamus TaxID=4465 RepID=A0AAV9EIK9_ACOCL|nr:hypothetical protein QJS10_CPA06g02287 [Acorus calamus]
MEVEPQPAIHLEIRAQRVPCLGRGGRQLSYFSCTNHLPKVDERPEVGLVDLGNRVMDGLHHVRMALLQDLSRAQPRVGPEDQVPEELHRHRRFPHPGPPVHGHPHLARLALPEPTCLRYLLPHVRQQALERAAPPRRHRLVLRHHPLQPGYELRGVVHHQVLDHRARTRTRPARVVPVLELDGPMVELAPWRAARHGHCGPIQIRKRVHAQPSDRLGPAHEEPAHGVPVRGPVVRGDADDQPAAGEAVELDLEEVLHRGVRWGVEESEFVRRVEGEPVGESVSGPSLDDSDPRVVEVDGGAVVVGVRTHAAGEVGEVREDLGEAVFHGGIGGHGGAEGVESGDVEVEGRLVEDGEGDVGFQEGMWG